MVALSALSSAAIAMLGCQIAVVDLGSNHAMVDAGADAGADAPIEPTVTSDCPGVTEAEIAALYGHPCGATCAVAAGPPRVIGSATELVAVTATQWRTCSGEVPWAPDVVGLEFQPGCTIFLLHDAPDGGVARSVLPGEQGNFNVVETDLGGTVTRALELNFPAWTWHVAVTTSDCPQRMRFDGAPGNSADFAAIADAPGPN